MKRVLMIGCVCCLLSGCLAVDLAGQAITDRVNEDIEKDNLKTTRVENPQFTKKIIEKGPYKIEIVNMWRENGKFADYACFDLKVANIGKDDILITDSFFSLILDSGRSTSVSPENADGTYFFSYKNKVGHILFPGVEKKGIFKMMIIDKQDNPKRLEIQLIGYDVIKIELT